MVKQGDIIWLDFDSQPALAGSKSSLKRANATGVDPQIGHEQKGRRPALVVSNETFNRFSNLAIVCPITNTNKDHPFHVKLDENTKTTGVILSDQARTLDIKARNYELIEKITDDILFEVIDIISGFIELENKK